MNSVDRVKELCKEYKIPVSRLEKELGFSNGYISQLRKGSFQITFMSRSIIYFSEVNVWIQMMKIAMIFPMIWKF